MKITADLIQRSPQTTNALNQRQLDLRGNKISQIENLGATLDFFQCLDLSDNEIRKFYNFSFLQRLTTLIIANNRISKLTDCSEMLPNLVNLCLMTNKLIDLNQIDNLINFTKLQRLILINNPLVQIKNYRLYVIYRLPSLKILDFKKITPNEKKQAEVLFDKLIDKPSGGQKESKIKAKKEKTEG